MPGARASKPSTSKSKSKATQARHSVSHSYSPLHLKLEQMQQQKLQQRASTAYGRAECAKLKASQVEQRLTKKELTKTDVKKLTTQQIHEMLNAKELQLEQAKERLKEAANFVPAEFKARLQKMPLKALKADAKHQVAVVRHKAHRVRMAAARHVSSGASRYGPFTFGAGHSGGGGGSIGGGGGGGGFGPPDEPSLDECEAELEDEVAKLEYIDALIEASRECSVPLRPPNPLSPSQPPSITIHMPLR